MFNLITSNDSGIVTIARNIEKDERSGASKTFQPFARRAKYESCKSLLASNFENGIVKLVGKFHIFGLIDIPELIVGTAHVGSCYPERKYLVDLRGF
jgi:hypothetical protein